MTIIFFVFILYGAFKIAGCDFDQIQRRNTMKTLIVFLIFSYSLSAFAAKNNLDYEALRKLRNLGGNNNIDKGCSDQIQKVNSLEEERTLAYNKLRENEKQMRKNEEKFRRLSNQKNEFEALYKPHPSPPIAGLYKSNQTSLTPRPDVNLVLSRERDLDRQLKQTAKRGSSLTAKAFANLTRMERKSAEFWAAFKGLGNKCRNSTIKLQKPMEEVKLKTRR